MAEIPEYSSAFMSKEESALSNRFLASGHVIEPVSDRSALDKMRSFIVTNAAEYLELKAPEDHELFLNTIHERVSVEKLNAFRMHLINAINNQPWFRALYLSLARKTVDVLVGNELAIQKRVNLSVQLPGDDSSLLPIHADVWSGDSPFEVVIWVPLVDCFKTKSMYLLPPEKDQIARELFSSGKVTSGEQLFKELENEVNWMEVAYGNVLVFSHTLPHGNIVNKEVESRWSMNFRVKGAFTPYWQKELGEFFEPVTLRAASRFGLEYKLPKVG